MDSVSLEIQAIHFNADLYEKDDAIAWAEDHGHPVQAVREEMFEGRLIRHIVACFEPSEAIEGSWRTASDEYPAGIHVSYCERAKSMDTNKAYSTFEVKSFDEEERIITGIASTPSPDRDGDEVMPLGAKFTLPFPLLAQHDHSQPVGSVIEAKASSEGIFITAQLAKESGLEYVEATWKQLKAGLLRGLSIGFRPTKSAPGAKGMKFLEYDLFELSLVTIPANAQAGIATVKEYANAPEVSDEQLFDAEAYKHDVLNRAAAAISKSQSILNTKGK